MDDEAARAAGFLPPAGSPTATSDDLDSLGGDPFLAEMQRPTADLEDDVAHAPASTSEWVDQQAAQLGSALGPGGPSSSPAPAAEDSTGSLGQASSLSFVPPFAEQMTPVASPMKSPLKVPKKLRTPRKKGEEDLAMIQIGAAEVATLPERGSSAWLASMPPPPPPADPYGDAAVTIQKAERGRQARAAATGIRGDGQQQEDPSEARDGPSPTREHQAAADLPSPSMRPPSAGEEALAAMTSDSLEPPPEPQPRATAVAGSSSDGLSAEGAAQLIQRQYRGHTGRQEAHRRREQAQAPQSLEEPLPVPVFVHKFSVQTTEGGRLVAASSRLHPPLPEDTATLVAATPRTLIPRTLGEDKLPLPAHKTVNFDALPSLATAAGRDALWNPPKVSAVVEIPLPEPAGSSFKQKLPTISLELTSSAPSFKADPASKHRDLLEMTENQLRKSREVRGMIAAKYAGGLDVELPSGHAATLHRLESLDPLATTKLVGWEQDETDLGALSSRPYDVLVPNPPEVLNAPSTKMQNKTKKKAGTSKLPPLLSSAAITKGKLPGQKNLEEYASGLLANMQSSLLNSGPDPTPLGHLPKRTGPEVSRKAAAALQQTHAEASAMLPWRPPTIRERLDVQRKQAELQMQAALDARMKAIGRQSAAQLDELVGRHRSNQVLYRSNKRAGR